VTKLRYRISVRRAAGILSGPRDEGIAFDIKAQMAPGPVPRVINADSRPLHNDEGLSVRRFSDEEVVAEQVVRIQSFVDTHGTTQQARALRSPLDVFDWFNRSQQYGRRMALALGDDVHAPVDAVYQIDIRAAGRPEHHASTRGEPLGGVRRQIVRPQVGLDFDDPPDEIESIQAVNELFAQQFPRNEDRVAVVKRAWQFSHGCSIALGARSGNAPFSRSGLRRCERLAPGWPAGYSHERTPW